MLFPSGNPSKCHGEVLYLQPFLWSHLNVLTFFSPLTGGCSEGLGAFWFFFPQQLLLLSVQCVSSALSAEYGSIDGDQSCSWQARQGKWYFPTCCPVRAWEFGLARRVRPSHPAPSHSFSIPIMLTNLVYWCLYFHKTVGQHGRSQLCLYSEVLSGDSA